MINQTDKKMLNKKIFYLVCIIIFILGLLVSTFTFAYFVNRDEVSNKVMANDIEIELIEPEWYESGINDAKNLEPGMIIAKDPKVLNKSANPVYIRMSFKILDGNGTEITDERAEKIINAIYFSDEIADKKIDDNPNFKKIDNWYYYCDDNKNLLLLDVGRTTPEFFSYIKIPTLKSAYNNIFDSDFSIEVEAQAVNTNEDNLTEEDIIEIFNERYK